MMLLELSLIYLFAANSHQINKKQRVFEFRPTVHVCSGYFHVSIHQNQFTFFLKTVFLTLLPQTTVLLVAHELTLLKKKKKNEFTFGNCSMRNCKFTLNYHDWSGHHRRPEHSQNVISNVVKKKIISQKKKKKTLKYCGELIQSASHSQQCYLLEQVITTKAHLLENYFYRPS